MPFLAKAGAIPYIGRQGGPRRVAPVAHPFFQTWFDPKQR